MPIENVEVSRLTSVSARVIIAFRRERYSLWNAEMRNVVIDDDNIEIKLECPLR